MDPSVQCDHGCQSGNRLRNPADRRQPLCRQLDRRPRLDHGDRQKAMPMIGLFLLALLLITLYRLCRWDCYNAEWTLGNVEVLKDFI